MKMVKRKKIVYINENADFNDDFIDEEDFIDENEDSLNEADGENGPAPTNEPEPPMDEEKLRIESLKLATSVAKLMDNVTPEDIVTIAGMLAEFIRNNKSGDIDANDVAEFGNDESDFNDEMPDDFDEGDDEDNEE